MRSKQLSIRAGALLLAACLTPHAALAQFVKGEWPWNLKLHSFHDEPVNRKLGTGWFMNVGPTGLRARITSEHPAYFTIAFVFEDSPAAGKIAAGDIVVGANGTLLKTPQQFGRAPGWDGPMLDMAALIEDSQGADGELELIVWPGGSQAERKTVVLQLEPVGRFSKTYPFDCERSEQLIGDLCDFLAQEYRREGKFVSRIHTHSACVLALMASGDSKYDPIVKRCMAAYRGKRYDSGAGVGYPSWNFGHDGIVMGEYYLLTRDKALLPAIQSLSECMEAGQTWKSGGYSHKPSPFIMNRVAGGGPKGYGAMSTPGGLVMIAQSLFKEAGLDYSQECYQRLHQAYLYSWSPGGGIGYGFAEWDHAVLGLKGPAQSWTRSVQGIGYRVPEGMTGIGDYDVVWPTKADPRYKDTSWLDTETDRVRVYQLSDTTRLAVRNMWRPEPKEPYRKSRERIGHLARSGTGALAHGIGNPDDESWNYMADHLASACARSPEALLDGHASATMHTLWGSLGAARADEKLFRAYMDYNKWWFVMAQTHDGGFVVMPGRDYAPTDHVYANRNFPTAAAALILGVKKRRLLITGADSTGGAALGPLAELEGDGFRVVHCVKEAKALSGKASFAKVLRSLDLLAAKDDERGREALVFAGKLRSWIAARNEALLERSRTRPAKTLIDSESHLGRLRGLDEAAALQARMSEIRALEGIRALVAAHGAHAKIIEKERKSGSSSKRERLAATLAGLLRRGDLDDTVRGEAEQLLKTLRR